MAKKDPKPVLGYIHCEKCDTRATVHKQGGQKHRWLYKRCECGSPCEYSAGAQSVLYYKTEWIDTVPDKPPNATKDALEVYEDRLKKQYSQEQLETKPDVVLSEESETVQETVTNANSEVKKPVLVALAAVTTMTLLALIGRKA